MSAKNWTQQVMTMLGEIKQGSCQPNAIKRQKHYAKVKSKMI